MEDRAVHYQLADGVATIRIDDGKRNALSPSVLRQIAAAFDRAEVDRAVVVMTGRDDVFSAGFDLKVLRGSPLPALDMLRRGFSLPARILAYPFPVIAACNGHVLAMGVFLALSADHVIGTRGDFKIVANEVAIGLTMPRVGAAMLRHRLTPGAAQRAITLSAPFRPDEALQAGFFDELVEPLALLEAATARAHEVQSLDQRAHRTTKRRIRRVLIRTLRRAVPLDLADAALLGLRAAAG